jgi:hypothetical protein
MGKTAKRQNKRAAALLGAKGGSTGKKKTTTQVLAASAAATTGTMGMQTDDAKGIDIRSVAVSKTKSPTSIMRIVRAVEADLTQEACVALDALLAEVERGEREDAASLDLCSKVLGMCQRAGKAKPALRLLTRMELCGLPVGPVQMRQVFFACCARGMVGEALALMSRRDAGAGVRFLGKDVLVRGCGMVPGGVDAPLALVLLEGALRGFASGTTHWEPVPGPEMLRIHPPTLWRPPGFEKREAASGKSDGKETSEVLTDVSAAADALARRLYPGGGDGGESFWLVSDDDGRRRPADRDALELWAPSTARTLFLEPAGLEPETERFDVPGVPGAFCLTHFLTEKETASLRAAAHAVGWRRDANAVHADGTLRDDRLEYCELLVWPSFVDRLWHRIKSHASPVSNAGAVGVNARFRVFRYGPETTYRKHVDGSWPEAYLTPEGEYIVDKSDGKVRSRLTLLVYLNDGFGGGATTFFGAVPGAPGEIASTGVVPVEGACLCFPHGDAEDSPVHEGSAVFEGKNGTKYKYIVRTDILFEVQGE